MEGPSYIPAVSGGPLRQGEILSSLEQYLARAADSAGMAPVDLRLKTHPFAVVLTQDCDLAQDFAGRQGAAQNKLLVPNILMCEMDFAEDLKGDADRIARGSDIWKRIVHNKDERFHYLREVTRDADASGEGVAPLLVDFKRSFTLPTEGLYEQLSRNAKRRAILTCPYREHLASRHAFFISRVALPVDHHDPWPEAK